VELYLHFPLMSVGCLETTVPTLYVGRNVDSFTYRTLYPWRKIPIVGWTGDWWGPHIRSERFGEGKILYPCWEFQWNSL